MRYNGRSLKQVLLARPATILSRDRRHAKKGHPCKEHWLLHFSVYTQDTMNQGLPSTVGRQMWLYVVCFVSCKPVYVWNGASNSTGTFRCARLCLTNLWPFYEYYSFFFYLYMYFIALFNMFSYVSSHASIFCFCLAISVLFQINDWPSVWDCLLWGKLNWGQDTIKTHG